MMRYLECDLSPHVWLRGEAFVWSLSRQASEHFLFLPRRLAGSFAADNAASMRNVGIVTQEARRWA